MVASSDPKDPPDLDSAPPTAQDAPEVPLSEEDAALFEALPPEVARLLYPEASTEPLTVTMVYPELDESLRGRAAELEAIAEEHTVNDLEGPGETLEHRTTFRMRQVEEFHQLYHLVETAIGAGRIRLLFNGHVVPMDRQLWLPLIWTLRS